MTAKEFRMRLVELDLETPQLARLIGVSVALTRRWYLYGLDEGVGGAQAVTAFLLRFMEVIEPAVRLQALAKLKQPENNGA